MKNRKVFFGLTAFTVLFFFTAQAVSAVNISVTAIPSSTSIASDQPIAATYIFTAPPGQNLKVYDSTAAFIIPGGATLTTINVPANFFITGGEQNQTSDAVYIPGSIKNQIVNGQVIYRRTFYGVDDFGASANISADINVTITSGLGAKFSVTRVYIDNPSAAALFKQDGDFSAHAFIEGKGTGLINGFWCIDNMPLENFQANMLNGVTVEVTSKNRLFTTNLGQHRLWIKIISPVSFYSDSVFYVITETATNIAKLNTPGAGKIFSARYEPPIFSWTVIPGALEYKIAVVKDTDHFDETQWYSADTSFWTPPKDMWNGMEPGTYYWAVRVVDVNRQLCPMSKVCYFKIAQ